MRASIKKAIGTTVQDMLDSGLKSSFTKKELNSLGVKIPEIVITSVEIKEIREIRVRFGPRQNSTQNDQFKNSYQSW